MIPAWVEGVAIAVEPYGSRVTCDPPPTDTDEDWLVLVTEFDTLHYALVDTGFARSDRGTETLRLLDRLDQGMHRLLSERANDPVVEEAHRDVHDLAALLSDNPEIAATMIPGDVPYFWLGADAEASRTTRVVVDPNTIETRNVLAPLPDDPVTDALPSLRSWPMPDDFWP